MGQELLAKLLVVVGLLAITFGAGWHYGAKGPKKQLDIIKAELRIAKQQAELENERITRAGKAAAIAAATRVREADVGAQAARAEARRAAVQLGRAMRDLSDVRRVLGADTSASPPDAPSSPAGSLRADPSPDLAGGLAACEAALATTVDAFAYNRANHTRCLARLESWQEFWRSFEQSYKQDNTR